jgi:alanine or glycine:cation symporter, AGCS family
LIPIVSIIEVINAFVWGPWMMVFLVGTGVWLTFGTGLVQFRKLGFAWKMLYRSVRGKDLEDDSTPGEITPFQALMMALSATVGNGNIAGVAAAISIGGPGAPVWMWLTGIFGMATKFAEVVLGIKYRQIQPDGTIAGGPMYFLEHGLGLKWTAWLFALFGAIAAFGIGNMVQANSVALVFRTELGVPQWISGLFLAGMTYLVIIGGVKRIGHVAEILVPIMLLIYIAGGLTLILMRISEVPAAFHLIFDSAFNGQAAVGGFAGAGVSQALRYGVARGIFSNEAGLGTASIAHGAARVREPVRQGSIAMLGVFIDTMIVNTITTLAIVLSGVWTTGLTSTALTAKGFTTVLGPLGGWIVAFGSITFGYSTLLTWSYYGLSCVNYISGVRASLIYRWAWCIVIVIGALFSSDLLWVKFVWDLADTINGAMAIPNLIGLLGLSMIVFSDTNVYFPLGGKKSQTPPSPHNVEGILDERFLQSRLDSLGMTQMEKYLELFRQTHTRTIGQIESNWHNQNFDSLRGEAHTLKGAASALGMAGLSTLSAKIEELAAQENAGELEIFLDFIRPEFLETLENIEMFFDSKKS